MPTAFITGITGQDGSYLADRLVADGWQVHGLIHEAAGLPTEPVLPPVAVLHAGDLADGAALAALVSDVAPDEIYHLGGISSVAYSWTDPLATVRVNALGSAAIVEAAWRLQQASNRPVRVLNAASAEIFGMPVRAPQDEATPVVPVSPYGATKAFAHQLMGSYRARGLFVTSTILFNHESPRRPEGFVTRKIARAVARIGAGTQERLVLGSLDSRRDWGWAPDYVDAMVRAMRHGIAQDYVIATGVAHSVADFVAAAFAHVGITDWTGLVQTDPEFTRPAEATELRGDAARARAELGWAPTVDFADLVGRMVAADQEREGVGQRAL